MLNDLPVGIVLHTERVVQDPGDVVLTGAKKAANDWGRNIFCKYITAMFYLTEAQFPFSMAFQSPAWKQKVNIFTVQFYYVTF